MGETASEGVERMSVSWTAKLRTGTSVPRAAAPSDGTASAPCLQQSSPPPFLLWLPLIFLDLTYHVLNMSVRAFHFFSECLYDEQADKRVLYNSMLVGTFACKCLALRHGRLMQSISSGPS